MEHRGMRIVAVSLYIIMLAAFMEWNLFVLFDIQMIFFVLVGVAIYVLIDCREDATLKNLAHSVQEAVYPVGILCSLLLLFYQFCETGKAGFSYAELALNLRPVFYAVILFYVLDKKDKTITSNGEHSNKDIVMVEQRTYFLLKEKGLTERETEVVKLIRKGLSNYAIGEELYITESTVKKHITHIYEKLGVSGRRQLIQYCEEVKEVQEEP